MPLEKYRLVKEDHRNFLQVTNLKRGGCGLFHSTIPVSAYTGEKKERKSCSG
jgi:hypothetical protein